MQRLAVPAWLTGTLLGIAALLFSLATFELSNDHFGRISPARQIARFGELPFRDFFDPGYVLAELSSAGVQRLLGDSLIGEALLTSGFIAAGTVLVWLLARRISSSSLAGIVAAVLALMLLPREYDYDKILFYPMGVLFAWRYVERPAVARVWALGAVVVVAGLYRYDNGAFIAAVGVVSMAVLHAHEKRVLAKRLGVLAATSFCVALPVLVFLQLNGALASAVDQVVTYGRHEAARTRLNYPPELSIDRLASVDDEPSYLPRVRLLPGAWHADNANAFLYLLFRLLPLVALVVAVLDSRVPGRGSRQQIARLTGLATLCLALNVFIMRDPVSARFGGMAGPTAILAAWMFRRIGQVEHGPMRWGLRTVGVLALMVTVWSVSVSANWVSRIGPDSARPSHLARWLAVLAASPPSVELLPKSELLDLVRYLRECTSPRERVLLTWFAPEVYFFAQRGFAGGIAVLFGGHWSDPRFMDKAVQVLEAQSPPLVISPFGDDTFRKSYPALARYLDEHYQEAGESTVAGASGSGPRFIVYRRHERRASETYGESNLPCFR